MTRFIFIMVLLFSFLEISQTSFAEQTRPISSTRPEVQCMAEAIYSESRAEPYQGQLAVATVIINRTEDTRFPHTVCGVVRQGSHNSCQFQGLCGKLVNIVRNKEQWENCIDIAMHVIYFEERQEQIYRQHAILFHNRHVDPIWGHTKKLVIVIGGHLFFGDHKPEQFKMEAS